MALFRRHENVARNGPCGPSGAGRQHAASSIECSALNSSPGIPESNVNTRRSRIGMSTECSLYSPSRPKSSFLTPCWACRKISSLRNLTRCKSLVSFARAATERIIVAKILRLSTITTILPFHRPSDHGQDIIALIANCSTARNLQG